MFIPESRFGIRPEPDKLTSSLLCYDFRREYRSFTSLIPLCFDLGGGNSGGNTVCGGQNGALIYD